jgi:hypothetical protein
MALEAIYILSKAAFARRWQEHCSLQLKGCDFQTGFSRLVYPAV